MNKQNKMLIRLFVLIFSAKRKCRDLSHNKTTFILFWNKEFSYKKKYLKIYIYKI